MVRQCDAMHRSNAFDGEGQGGCVDAMCLSSVPCLRADVLPPTAAPPLARMEFDYHVRRYHHKNLGEFNPPPQKNVAKNVPGIQGLRMGASILRRPCFG